MCGLILLWIFLFCWFACLFLCHYQAVFITSSLCYVLKSCILMPRAFFLLFRIALTLQCVLCFHMNFSIILSEKNFKIILMRLIFWILFLVVWTIWLYSINPWTCMIIPCLVSYISLITFIGQVDYKLFKFCAAIVNES